MPRWSEKFGGTQKYFWIQQEQSKPACASCAWMMEGNEKFRSLSDSKLWEPEAYIEKQIARGIDVMALSPTPQTFYYGADPAHAREIAAFQNDQIARLQQDFPKNFCGLGTVPLQDTEMACRELERCVKELRLPGVEIATSCRGEDLAATKFFPFFEAAAKFGACIFVHPWYMPNSERLQPSGKEGEGWGNWLVGMPTETTTAMFKLCLAGLMEKLPELRIGFAHGGGSFAWLLERMKHGAAVRPEYFPAGIDFEKFARSVYFDSHVCGIRELRHLIEVVGPKRVMAGSDWPYPLGVENLKQFIDGLGDAALAKQILTGTPRDFLGLNS